MRVSSRPRFDVVVNLLAEQAFSKRHLQCLVEIKLDHISTSQTCVASIHFFERPHLSGVFNASFENMSVKALAERIAEKVEFRLILRHQTILVVTGCPQIKFRLVFGPNIQ